MPCSLFILRFLLAFTAGQAGAQVVLSPVHYDLDLKVDFKSEVLTGTARIELENPSEQPVSRASLLLYRLMKVRSVRDDGGKDLVFNQEVVAFEDSGRLQVDHVLVTLPKPLARGERTAFTIRYDGYLLGYAETGMLYIQDRIDPEFTILRDDSYAFPRPGFPSRRINRSGPEWSYSWSAAVTVPKGLTVANGGRLEGTDDLGDQVTFRYSSSKPSWRMDFAIAKYAKLTSGPIRVFHLPGDGDGASGVAEAGAKSFGLFTDWFGPLPAPSPLTFIEIPDGWGSQADATAIIQSAAAFRDPNRYREVYHEVSHLWNVVSTDRPSPRWNEGLATFLEALVTQELTGKPAVDAEANENIESLARKLPDRPTWKSVPLIDYGRAGLTDLSYSVGELFFDLLYRLVGRGDFNRIIGGFTAKFGSTGGGTRDFVGILKDTASIDVSHLVDDWINTTAWTERVSTGVSIADLEAYYRGRERKESP